jgi:ribulose-bisphosphate carboxylase large chain
MLLGLPFFHKLCQRRASVPVLAHPSFAGVQRFGPEVLFGKLLRLFGADAVIYVNFGSRFRRTREQCARLAGYLRDPWGAALPSLPVPAGGIKLDNAAELIGFYGNDTMLLVGGDLQVEPGAVAERTRRFVEAVEAAAV